MKLVIGDGKCIDADSIVTGRTCVIGQSGSGKSYTVAVICEELAKNNIGFCIIDLEGEYFSLKEKYPILWIGSDSNADINIENLNYKNLAHKLIDKGFPAVFDVSELSNPQEAVGLFLKELYNIETKYKKPYLIIVEEIDKFAPQKGKVLPEVEEISRRGRKRGLGLMVATQRPALVNKNVLSQCSNQIIGKLTIGNDIDAVKIFFSEKKQLDRLPMLEPGNFFIQGTLNPKGEVVKIRQRETKHKAVTPKLIQRTAIRTDDLKTIEAELEIPEQEEFEEIKKEHIPAKVSQQEAFEKIKSKTGKFLFFGTDSNISNLHLKLYPMFLCKIRHVKKSVLKKEFNEFYTYFDGIEGNIVSLDKGIKVEHELSGIVGLDEKEINLLKNLIKFKQLSVTELSFKTGYSDTTVHNLIKTLSKRSLIKSKKIGRNILYSVFSSIKIPKIGDLKQKQMGLSNEEITAEIVEHKIEINQLKSIIKGINEEADIIEKKIIYYPYYEAMIIKGNSKYRIEMDAITKKITS